MTDRRPTSTSNFGVSKRESHDASGFYDRFRPPVITNDRDVRAPSPIPDPFVLGDARHLDVIAPGSVALVVTSPPYFAGKAYEEELERDGIPSSYLEYLEMLTDVLAECVTKLEPGGRLCVNVANLGRKPYRSLSSDVIRIMDHELGLLLRGEIIWQKAEGASGSCAWGSFRSASNPVLRDVTERIIVASKGRFDRARSVKERARDGLPHHSTVLTDEFLSSTLDIWTIAPERARRVGHPAPFPVELPERLIRLYSFDDDLVLDPFMGSGSTLVAAARLGRRYVGYDLDPDYVELARTRVANEGVAINGGATRRQAARQLGRSAIATVTDALGEAGFEILHLDHRVRGTGLSVPFVVTDATGSPWYVEVGGTFTSTGGGLTKPDAALRSLGRIAALRGKLGPHVPIMLLTTELPGRSSDADTMLRSSGPDLIFDVLDVLDDSDVGRLATYAARGPSADRHGFWSATELSSS